MIVVINLKNYKIGKDIYDLIKKIEIYYNNAIVAVPSLEIKEAIKNTSLTIYAQHVDSQDQGRSTGKIIPEALVSLGVQGSLLNHSENKIKIGEIKKTIKRCNELGLKLIVCASDLKEVKRLVKLRPWAIAFEDPRLIASGKSVTEHDSKEIKEFVSLLENSEITPLCGAGIHSGKDVASALVLGCKGILVSSVVANSSNPENFLKELGSLN